MPAHRIFVLTGAGVSAESGLGTFRDTNGMWKSVNPLALATPEAFARNPRAVHAFYDGRRRDLLLAAPNRAHLALGALQTRLAQAGGRLTLVTQNVDDLHERGGADEVLHMHGEILKARCMACGQVRRRETDLLDADACGDCGAQAALRPHVVWFGEAPFYAEAIFDALASCELFVAIGTSGAVYPASGLVAHARAAGVATLSLNRDEADNASLFDEARYGPATELVPAWAEEILAA